jgi:Domain of unknown function (DUF4177)
MPTVTCPTCGERGKIGANLFGSRIKCKKCASSFQVMAPAAKPTPAGAGVARAENPSGIAVEGLDASSWSLSTDVGEALQAQAVADPAAIPAAIATALATPGAYEYKLLTPRDKFFDGRFDLARLEEALNHYGRQGWTVKAMSTPHVKGFSGALEEFIVVVLER